MPNDTLAQAVARAMCGSPEICPACMEEAHGVIAAIRATPGWALVRTEGPEFEADLIARIPEGYTPGRWYWDFSGTAGKWCLWSHVGPVQTGGPPDISIDGDMALIALAPELAIALRAVVAELDEARAALARQSALIPTIQEAERAVGRREAGAEIADLRRLLSEAQRALPDDLRTFRGLRDRINRALSQEPANGQ